MPGGNPCQVASFSPNARTEAGGPVPSESSGAQPAVGKDQLNLGWEHSPVDFHTAKRTGQSADLLGQAWRLDCNGPLSL